VVDLDGALQGRPINQGAIASILAAVDLPVQLGGGIRDEATIADWLEVGLARVILGTAALRDAELVRRACRRWPGQVAIGIDARNGRVAIEGWAQTSEVTAVDLARRLEDAGAAALIHTDIERDGALTGPNVAATAALARAVKTPVIASGGVGTLTDLAALKAEAASGIAGVIVGRALYDGRIGPRAALDLLTA
jgi:phosphoribosylformimino-5-aminoimidazole carboxamide ribotide isomerase